MEKYLTSPTDFPSVTPVIQKEKEVQVQQEDQAPVVNTEAEGEDNGTTIQSKRES